jgi:hypothetical protein
MLVFGGYGVLPLLALFVVWLYCKIMDDRDVRRMRAEKCQVARGMGKAALEVACHPSLSLSRRPKSS